MSARSWRAAEETGSALVIALVFLSVFGLLMGFLLSFSETAFKATGVVRQKRSQSYSADGAVDAAIKAMQSYTLATCPTFTPQAINGVSTKVFTNGVGSTCAPNSDEDNLTNAPGQAVLTMATGSEDGFTNSSSNTLAVGGSVFSNTTIIGGSKQIAVDGLVEAKGTCSGITSADADGSGNPQGVKCSNTGGGFDPAHGVDPNYPAETTVVPTRLVGPTCPAGWLVTLQPGYYDSAAALSALTGSACADRVLWFKPGVYYFDFSFASGCSSVSCVWSIQPGGSRTSYVVGGEPLGWDPTAGARPTNVFPTDPALPRPQACRTGKTTPKATTGVEFIFGGQSQISMANGASLELCAPPNTTKQQIALYGLKTGSAAPTATQVVPNANAGVAGDLAFSNPTNAYAFDASTADASLPSNNTKAGIALVGYGLSPAPAAGSRLEGALLRIRHREVGGTAGTTVRATVTLATGATCPATGWTNDAAGCHRAFTLGFKTALAEDQVNLVANGLTTVSQALGFSVAYEVLRNTSPATAASLDAVVADVTYTTPAFESLGGCLAVAPYPATSGSCALITAGPKPRVAFNGTVYAPTAAIDLHLNQDASASGRGIIARTLVLSLSGNLAPGQAAISSPVVAVSGSGTSRRILFTAKYCATAPATVGSCSDAALTTLLEARVDFDDLSPTHPATVRSWDVRA
ncbi:MAG: hypothetical protein QOE35_719 [Actinomycetota bacterium]|jgi:hypothetical protein